MNTNHLQEAKEFVDHARKASGNQGTFADIAKALALIAIAEQLEYKNAYFESIDLYLKEITEYLGQWEDK